MGRDEYVGRLIDLVRGLIQKTAAGELEWTTESDSSFSLEGQTGEIYLFSQKGRFPFGIEILNKEGDVVESLKSIASPTDPGEEQFNNLIFELYEQARRSALQIDDVLEGLLREFGPDS